MVSSETESDHLESDNLLSESCLRTDFQEGHEEQDGHDGQVGHDEHIGDELLGVDPFSHKIEMPTWMW
jgi:hypothetical protein